MTRGRLLLRTLLTASLLAACGGGSASGSGSTEPPASLTQDASAQSTASTQSGGGSNLALDGCTIVTAADAQAIFGMPMAKSDAGTTTPQILAACVWDGGPGTGTMALVSKLLQFRVWDGSVFYAPDSYKEMPGFEKIDSLGDGAYAYGTGSFDLVILVGERTISLGASGFLPKDRDQVRQAVLGLAHDVLGRI